MDVNVSVIRAAAGEIRAPLLVVFHFQDEPAAFDAALDAAVGGALTRIVAEGDFRGRKDELTLLHGTGAEPGIRRLAVVGLGPRPSFRAETLRRAVGQAIRAAEKLPLTSVAISIAGVARDSLDPESAAVAAAESAVMAVWDWSELKARKEDENRTGRITEIRIIAASAEEEPVLRRGAERGAVLGRAANLARSLAIRPGNIATPTYLADAAGHIAARHGLSLTLLDRADMEREGMEALLAVARGTQEEPRFIVLEYRRGAADERPLVLVGKGVTFDSGGISIKPAERMEEMKYDMSGAAAVLGAMQGIAELGLAVNVVGLVPATENMPSGTAVKPGDVIGSLLGRSIEVVNTDAEGRLILADALAWAQRYQPAAMIDAATLTGAVGIALGQHAIGLMATDDTLAGEVIAAGERTGERCWRLPLWEEYRKQIDSPVADLKNTGGRPGGSITAGAFLRDFVGDIPWVHLDIAATAYRDEPAPYLRKGPTGFPARLFIEWVRTRTAA